MRIEQLLCTFKLVRNVETIPSCITDSVAILGHLEAALMIDPMKEDQLRKWPRWYRMRWDSWARRFGPTDAIKYNWLGTGTYGIVKMSFRCQMSAWVCLFSIFIVYVFQRHFHQNLHGNFHNLPFCMPRIYPFCVKIFGTGRFIVQCLVSIFRGFVFLDITLLVSSD